MQYQATSKKQERRKEEKQWLHQQTNQPYPYTPPTQSCIKHTSNKGSPSTQRMAAAAEEFSFWRMNEVQMRHWVEANPGRVDDKDRYGRTPLYVAVRDIKSLALTVWLVDEKGADVNGPISGG